MENILEQLCKLYVTYRQRYVLTLPGGKIFTPKKSNGEYCKLTNNVLLNHQAKQYAVAIFAGKWGSKFLCFDVDDGSRETVGVIFDKLEMLGIPRELIYVSYSGGKGYHVETFFDEIVSTQALKNLYGHVIWEGQLDPRKVEFRPTHGNAIKLPLSVHARTGNYCCFVDPVTFEPKETEKYFLQIRQNHVPDIHSALTLPEITTKTRASTENAGDKATKKGFPMKEESEERMLTEEGTRHDTMQRIAVYQRIQGTEREECRQILERWYAAQDPNTIRSTPEEVRKDMDDLLDWVFSEKFKMPAKPSQKNAALLSVRQMFRILDQNSRSERRIFFLLMLRYRMGQMRLSAESIGKTVGVCKTTVNHVIKKLTQAKIITMVPGERLSLGDGKFYCESNGYIVPCKGAYPEERQTEISMKNLMFDFDQTYFSAMQSQIPKHALYAKLSPAELEEYQSWLRMQKSGEKKEQQKTLINQQGTIIPRIHALYGSITGFEVQNHRLYPAVEAARLFGYSFPNVAGSQCPHKELWNVEMTVSRADREKTYTTIVEKNFIPEEDVRRMAQRSKRPDAEAILSWLLGEDGKEDANEK